MTTPLTAQERWDDWCRVHRIDLRQIDVRPTIRSDGVLNLVGREHYPIPEDCNMQRARLIEDIIRERERKKRRPATTSGE